MMTQEESILTENPMKRQPLLGVVPSFDKFPQDMLQEILSFIPDHVSICRSSLTCQSLYRAISTNDRLWERLFTQRWTTATVQTTPKNQTISTANPLVTSTNDDVNNCKWNKAYQQLHGSDKTAFGLLQEMAETISIQVHKETGQSETLKDWSGIGDPLQHGNWTRLRSKEFSTNIYNLMYAVANDGIDYPTLKYVRAVVGGFLTKWNITRSLAAIAVDAIHHHQVMKEWHTLFNNAGRQGSLLSGGGIHNPGGSNSDDEKLERGALLLVKSQLGWDDILVEGGGQKILQNTHDQLNNISEKYQARLETEGIDSRTCDTLRAVEGLNRFLIQDMGFEGNVDNYYDVRNSLLNNVLETRKGIPITLAVLYKLILARVGHRVNLIGLPGHVVLGIPPPYGSCTTTTFVDVFRGGRVLSLEDCQGIVREFGVSWKDEFSRPMSATEVLTRMLNNIAKCREMQINQQREKTAAATFAFEKIRALIMLTQLHYSPHTFMILEIWPEQMPCILDPEIFRRHGLIQDDTNLAS